MLGYENDCLGSTSGNYRTRQTYSYDNLYQLIKADGETTYNPYQSSVPEFVSSYSQGFAFDSDGLGNMTSKVSSESVTPQKTIGDNLNYSFKYVYDDSYAHRLINAGDRYYQYDTNGNIVREQDGAFDGSDENVTYHKITQEADDVYSTDYGWGLFKEDDKGSSGKANRTKYKRTYTWNERNQLVSSVDDNYSTAYIYGHDGQRSNKYTQNSETLYFNKMWTLHTDSGNSVYGGQTAKNIYLGETRIVTKLNSGTNPTYQEEYYKQYYYHSDHLGSASLITDYKGDEYQRIEYTPYGETWVEKTSNTGLEYMPYRFTGKEIDEETGLYYYGARYLDPRYSRWISTDPALGEYIPGAGKATASDAGSLPGMGGAYNSVNLNLYHYAGNNPLKYTDPNGLYSEDEIKAFSKSSGEEQMCFLKKEYNSVQGENCSDADRGSKAAEMRDLRDSMKLGKLFKQDENFMNGELRDFLNLKEDGTMNYDLKKDLTINNGWEELCSIGSQYHQSNAGDNNHLNAKFVNKDGREVVIGRTGEISTSYPDKGTFNYVNGDILSSILWGGHNLYDMKPYDRLMTNNNITTTKKYNGIFAGGAWYGNTHYWK